MGGTSSNATLQSQHHDARVEHCVAEREEHLHVGVQVMMVAT
jgi:hypothetical protein